MEQECKDKFDNADVNIWKYVGDEILFYIFINDKEVLYNSLSYIDEILSISIKKLMNLIKIQMQINIMNLTKI